MINKEWNFLQGVYRININNHFYVGSSVNIYKRLHVHLNDMKKNKHTNKYLQRTFNKYGISTVSFEILETCTTLTLHDLRIREKYYIDELKPDLNLKLDPVTEQNCVTTSKKVYQFNLFGEFIKEYPSMMEASRQLHIDSSNICVCCKNPKRQQKCKDSYWSYTQNLPFDIEILYIYDINGKYINRFTSTIDIYNTFFVNKLKKTVLSVLRKRINTYIPYDHTIFIFNHNNPDFSQINLKNHKRTLDKNTIVNRYDRQGILLESKPLSEYPNYVYHLMKRSKHSCYSVGKNTFLAGNSKKVNVYDLNENLIKTYDSSKLASLELFGFDDSKNINKHIKRNTPYKNYIFKRDL